MAILLAIFWLIRIFVAVELLACATHCTTHNEQMIFVALAVLLFDLKGKVENERK